jgi:hypothetical protein
MRLGESEIKEAFELFLCATRVAVLRLGCPSFANTKASIVAANSISGLAKGVSYFAVCGDPFRTKSHIQIT